MTKIYDDANERYLNTVLLYGKKGDNFLYEDEAMTTKVKRSDLINWCLKNYVQVLYDGTYLTPVSYKDDPDTGVASVTLWNADPETAAKIDVQSDKDAA